MIDITSLQNKHIVVLGLGLTGMSVVRFLASQGIAFSVNDSRSNAVDKDEFIQQFGQIKLVLGCWDSTLIAQADLIIASPGIDLNTPVLANCINKNTAVWGDIELYCQVTKLAPVPMVAVTGSNGKSTVVSLLDHLGKTLGVKTQLGGNIGVPVLDYLTNNLTPPTLLILELSSFQLETLSSMKAIAASLLNLSDDHLDRHQSMENYGAIKQRIYPQCLTAVINKDDVYSQYSSPAKNQKLIYFGTKQPKKNEFGIVSINDQLWLAFDQQPLIACNDLPIKGIHNAANCLAALAIGYAVGWKLTEMALALKSFIGLAHRCQLVESNDGIIWINDSKATNVGATLAAIEGISATLAPTQQLHIIVGGEGKGADFSPLKSVFENQVSTLFAIGKDGRALAALHENSEYFNTLEQAVVSARNIAKPNDVVLLSPACASLDMFKNYIARGNAFMEAVNNQQQEVC